MNSLNGRKMNNRGVAQSGRVLALGARCRRFKSYRPDQIHNTTVEVVFCFIDCEAMGFETTGK